MKDICAFLGALFSLILFLTGFCLYILVSFKCPPGFVLLRDVKRCINETLYYEYSTSEAIEFHPERENGIFLHILAVVMLALCVHILRDAVRQFTNFTTRSWLFTRIRRVCDLDVSPNNWYCGSNVFLRKMKWMPLERLSWEWIRDKARGERDITNLVWD